MTSYRTIGWTKLHQIERIHRAVIRAFTAHVNLHTCRIVSERRRVKDDWARKIEAKFCTIYTRAKLGEDGRNVPVTVSSSAEGPTSRILPLPFPCTNSHSHCYSRCCSYSFLFLSTPNRIPVSSRENYRLQLEFTILFQHDAPDATVKCGELVGHSLHSVFLLNTRSRSVSSA